MHTKQKYVRLKKLNSIVIFPEFIKHSDFKYLEPISAGFCTIDNENKRVLCYGYSDGLGLQSNISLDSELATRQILNQEL